MKKLPFLFLLLLCFTYLGNVQADEVWRDQDIGSTTPVGSMSYNAATDAFTVSGAGADIGGTADALHFGYLTTVGNGEMIARVVSQQNTDAAARAGVMIRESLAANAKSVSLLLSPTSGMSFLRRTATGGATTGTTVGAGLTAPYWVKVNRTGDVLTVSYSFNGVQWTMGGSQTVALTQMIYLGLAVSSHANGTLGTAVFDNVRVTTAPTPGTGTGLLGSYYDNRDLSIFKFTRLDSAVNFDWGSGSPDASMDAENFSVRWTGEVQPRYSEVYTFSTLTDDGVRVWLDGQLIIGNWRAHNLMENSATVALGAGEKHRLTLEYYERNGVAQAQLLWQSTSEARQTIATSQLYPASSPLTLQPPTRLVSPGRTSSTVALSWDPAAGAYGTVAYDVFKGTQQIGTGAGEASTFTAGTLLSNTSYVFSIRVRDANGQTSALGTPITVTTAPILALPAPWQTLDVGTVARPGAAAFENNQWFLAGAGSGISGTADAFRFVNQTLAGDGVIVARLTSQTMTGGGTKSGVMLRENTSPGARHAFLAYTPVSGVSFNRRPVANSDTTSTVNGAVPFNYGADGLAPTPVWLRLVRQSDLLSGAFSVDGTTWTSMGSETISLPPNTLAGLAVVSANPNALSTGVFDNVLVGKPPTVAITSPANNAAVLTSATVSFTAAATTPTASVVKVEFFEGTTKLGEDTTAPYNLSWSGMTVGTHCLTARATDSFGLVGTSAAINLIVALDIDNNGLLDAWEVQYFTAIGQNPAADPDGDTFTNLQEYLNGTDPTDYYNGTAPQIVLVRGNNQTPTASGQPLPVPFVVRTQTSAGVALGNAPVEFSVISGLGNLSSTIAVTAADGTASATFTPSNIALPATILAKAKNYSTSLTFTVAAVQDTTPPAEPEATSADRIPVNVDGTGGGVEVHWTHPTPNAVSFTIERTADGQHWQVIGNAGSGNLSYIDPTAQLGTVYFYRISAHH